MPGNPYTYKRVRLFDKCVWKSPNDKRPNMALIWRCQYCGRPHTLSHRKFHKYGNMKVKAECFVEDLEEDDDDHEEVELEEP